MNNFYRKEIDFLRAIAVLFVVFYHYFPELIPKGYLGVDLFFVISGFLISFQIYYLTEKNEFNLKDFYIRRIKRILPATLFTILIVFFIASYLFTYNDFYSLLKSIIYSLFFSSNFFFWMDGGYFGPNDELKPLLHFWSLSVEEQFYIIFPFLFLFLLKFIKNIKLIIFAVTVVIILSFTLNILLINIGGSNPAFFLLPTRVWNLGLGVLAMLIFVNKKKTHSNFEALFLIFLIFIGVSYEIPYLPTNFLIVFSCFMFLRKKLPKKFIFKKIFENKYFNYLGLISFSLYLWHWPLLVFFKYYYVYELNIWIKIMSLIIMFIISVFSYHFIELTFRYKFNFKKLIIGISAIYLLTTGTYFYQNNSKKSLEFEAYTPDFIASASLTNFKCEAKNFFLYNKMRGCVLNKPGINEYNLALVGNSHIQMYVPSVLPFLKNKSEKAILLPMTGCLPTLTLNINENCLVHSKKYFKKYAEDPKIKKVLIATTWWHKNIYDGKNYINDKNHLLLANSLINLIDKLENLNKDVYLVGPIQVPLYELPQELSRLLKFNHINKNQLIDKLKVKKIIYKNSYKEVNELLSKRLGKNFIDLSFSQCDDNYCYYADDKGVYFADGSHLSHYASNLFSDNFQVIFE